MVQARRVGGADSDGRAGIDAALVRRLLAAQFPQWQHLPVRPVELDGWDNRTYRLGDRMAVRLPTDAGYAPAVAKEYRWLPVLAPQLPVPIPVPLAIGKPGEGYPFEWSIRLWLAGEPAAPDRIGNGFATELADFLLALQAIDPTDGPSAGEHSFYRGAELAHYDDEIRSSLRLLAERPDRGGVDIGLATAVWEAALVSRWAGPPRWFHGDVAAGNLLVEQGRLSAVIDFGTCGVGDPACDLVIAWTLLRGPAREVFRSRIGQDGASWARARGWALWKALITLVADLDAGNEPGAGANRRIIAELLAEPDSNAVGNLGRPDSPTRPVGGDGVSS
jgi:aminoglycoside phosphotransferase (APT) family kinase protein